MECYRMYRPVRHARTSGLAIASGAMITSRSLRCPWLFLIALTGMLLLGGCAPKNLGIATSQMMPEPLPQHFEVAAPAEKVFAIVVGEAERTKDCRVLTKSTKDLVISWCERVEQWNDLGIDTVGVNPKIMGANHDAFKKLAVDTGKGVAIITVWIEPRGTRSRVNIRRVTYGDQSFAGMGHSRGEFERQLLQRITSQI